jgi:hypothetical protein
MVSLNSNKATEKNKEILREDWSSDQDSNRAPPTGLSDSGDIEYRMRVDVEGRDRCLFQAIGLAFSLMDRNNEKP